MPHCSWDRGREVLGLVDSNGLRLDQTVVIASRTPTTTETGGTPRRIHSVAADPNTNQIYVPIPAAGGAAPTSIRRFARMCSKNRIGSPTTATGCIAVLQQQHNDPSSVANGIWMAISSEC